MYVVTQKIQKIIAIQHTIEGVDRYFFSVDLFMKEFLREYRRMFLHKGQYLLFMTIHSFYYDCFFICKIILFVEQSQMYIGTIRQ